MKICIRNVYMHFSFMYVWCISKT